MTVLVSGTFTTTGTSAEVTVSGAANVFINIPEDSLSLVGLERSFDGVNFYPVSRDLKGNKAQFNATYNGVIDELETGIKYRFNCTLCGGTITYRLSQ